MTDVKTKFDFSEIDDQIVRGLAFFSKDIGFVSWFEERFPHRQINSFVECNHLFEVSPSEATLIKLTWGSE